MPSPTSADAPASFGYQPAARDTEREAAERGRKVLRGQRYEVQKAYAVGDTVILEVLWVGTLAVPVGELPAGGEMRAHFAVFLEIRDGLIYRQRNYDCFEPF
jgi:ketosteroid isomerase-like protein